MRRLALSAFRHLHALSLRFHLDRRTGGLARAVERGTQAIDFLLTFILFNIVPTVVEILVVCGILWRLYDWQFAAVTFATIAVYIAFTFLMTDWRVRFRQEMNARDSEANTKAIDSLLNYETVKYFANEEHEARRYDRSLQAYEKAAVKSETTLALLNVGQGLIIACGLVGMMLLAAWGVADARMTVGDFVLVNAYLIQLYLPLNFLGMVYRNIKQSLVDLEQMLALSRSRPDHRSQNAPALAVRKARSPSPVDFRYDRASVSRTSFRVPPGHTVAMSGRRRRQIDDRPPFFRFYDVDAGRSYRQQDPRGHARQPAPGDRRARTRCCSTTRSSTTSLCRPGASRGEIEAAARFARIHDFVMHCPTATRHGRRTRAQTVGRREAASRSPG